MYNILHYMLIDTIYNSNMVINKWQININIIKNSKYEIKWVKHKLQNI